jgi:hypothetical protein
MFVQTFCTTSRRPETGRSRRRLGACSGAAIALPEHAIARRLTCKADNHGPRYTPPDRRVNRDTGSRPARSGRRDRPAAPCLTSALRPLNAGRGAAHGVPAALTVKGASRRKRRPRAASLDREPPRP